MLSSMLSRAAPAVGRGLSTAATSGAAAPVVDWALVRAKMLTDETRAEADRAREMFQKRLSAAEGTRPAAEIEWDAFARALPEVDVAATRAAYSKVAAALPRVTYDAAADVAAHSVKEAAWTGFASYCAARVTELEALAAEQSKHRLHRWYRRRQLFSRFPGLYESLHNKVRGQWDVDTWATYLAYRSKTQALPWDPNYGEVTEEAKSELKVAVAKKAGVSPEALGWSVPAAK